MEKSMKGLPIPQTDSIRELAQFWDTHDLTDFDDQLEEVITPIFEQPKVIELQFEPDEMKAVESLARKSGMGREKLIKKWILEKLHPV